MDNDGLAILVLLGLGGFVLWYLTRPQPTQVQTTQGKQDPCYVGVKGVTASCGAIASGYGAVKDLWNETLGKVIPEQFQFGSSELCRVDPNQPHGGKAVYGNDMQECQKRYGITDCVQCGKLFNVATRMWPWTEELNTKVGRPLGTPASGFTVKELLNWGSKSGDPLKSEPQATSGFTSKISRIPLFR